MKKLLILVFALYIGVLLMGCGGSSDDDESYSNYTLMYYEIGDSAGSGDLSSYIKYTIKSLANIETEKVNVVCQFKLNDSNDIHRGVVKECGEDCANYPTVKTGKMTDGDTLSEFISYCKTKCPAESYILVIGGHGSGYDYHETKGTLYSNDGSFLANGTIGEVCKPFGIDACLFDTCLLGCFENLQCSYDAFKYIVASEKSVQMYDICFLVDALNSSNNDLEKSLCYFIDKQSEYYKTTDVKLIKTDYYPQVISSVKKIISFLNKEKYMSQITTVRTSLQPVREDTYMYDFEDFIYAMQNSINSAEFNTLVKEFKSDKENCLSYNYAVTAGNGFSLSFPTKDMYDNYFANYSQTLFAQATGWDDLLNNQKN